MLALDPRAEEYFMLKQCCVALAALGLSTSAVAQQVSETVDLEIYRPFSDAYGYMHSPSAATLGPMRTPQSIQTNWLPPRCRQLI